MYRLFKDKRYQGFAHHLLDDLLKKATIEKDRLSWPQAENRRQPNLLELQTGLMQGASGIGLTLLHVDAQLRKRNYRIKLPDNPY
jgi:hypothetical protein